MTDADVDEAAVLVRTSWAATYGPLIGAERAEAESSRRHQPVQIAADLRRPHAESFVAEGPNGTIVGYAHAKVEKGMLWLDRLYVAAKARGSGVAASLLHAVISNYVGESSISLEVLAGNARAIGFYEREGFVVTERRDACGGIAGVPTLVMRKAISRA